jgi:nitrite reductase (NADH) small subunit
MNQGTHMNLWTDILDVNDIPKLGARVVRHGSLNIAVFRNADDEIFALEDRCPHKGGPLSQGIVHGRKVTCPLHGWNIELDSGCAVAPDQGCAREFPIKLEAGRVWLDLSAAEQATA